MSFNNQCIGDNYVDRFLIYFVDVLKYSCPAGI